MRAPWAPWPLLWAVLQLGWRPGWLQGCPERPESPLTLLPARLTVPEGGGATFTCSFPNTSKPTVLNWYRGSPSNQSVKLAAYPQDRGEPARDRRFSITKLADSQAFHLHISHVLHNDSGTYYCGAINLPPETQITESPCAELTVTDKILEAPTMYPSPAPRTVGRYQVLAIVVTSVLVGILVLLLLVWVLATILPRGTQGTDRAQSSGEPLKGDPSAVPVFTVDYGELDFQRREKTPEPPTTCSPGQTEYATIVFPGSVAPEGRRGSADGLQGLRPLRLDDTHCSWPL
ncbi:programmed cell death protein 1 [Orycteropus afer afer]|uniref:Programmed cell death protein 1 n=1 Tax=Orycteropus afer afer TaxID=1230840 RepID=A0A8B7A0D7_ORYAF|nr:programmed cell death protein 1 [Orycteropus afer afer]